MAHIKEDYSSATASSDYAELLRWHYHSGHMSFPKLKKLTLSNFIPKRLARVHNPKCACCVYGAMTKQPYIISNDVQLGKKKSRKVDLHKIHEI